MLIYTNTEKTKLTEQERIIRDLEDEELKGLIAAADDCGFCFYFSTEEELLEEIEEIKDNYLLTFETFEDYADSIIDDMLFDIDEPLASYFDRQKFANDLDLETNYSDDYNGLCYIFTH